ncbi:hypothetical protein GGR54DRAFT_616613 [Hypoxylon sp. NC1633]|nr:hypothetical protein GGR54DRAFT_616613 [Hypoxylon sp. NC1633]
MHRCRYSYRSITARFHFEAMALPFSHPNALLPPGFAMSRCVPADAPGMTEIFMKAFPAGSDFTFWWSPSITVMRTWHQARIAGRFADPNTQQFKVVDESTGNIVAWAKWDPPRSMEGLRAGFVTYGEDGRPVEQLARQKGEGEYKAKKLSAPEGADEKLYEAFFGGLRSMGEKWRSSEKLVLSLICSDPAYHGRGIASALIKSVLAIADAEHLTAYLEALPLAAPLYRRLGFVGVDTLEFDLTRAGMKGTAVQTIMIREPGSAPVV